MVEYAILSDSQALVRAPYGIFGKHYFTFIIMMMYLIYQNLEIRSFHLTLFYTIMFFSP